MCGRFTLTYPPEKLGELFHLASPPELVPRYNIAPSQNIAAIRRAVDQEGRRIEFFRWGLIPSWAKDPAIGNRMINARAETVAEKPSFRSAFRSRRCLVLADGFYEWKRLKQRKQPYLIQMRDGRPFAFAALWERWESPEGKVTESCTLLTTTPNELISQIHHRMPVILRPEDHALWLDPAVKTLDGLGHLLVPFPSEEMVAVPVGQHVNNPAHDAPDCLMPAEPSPPEGEPLPAPDGSCASPPGDPEEQG